MPRLLDDVTHAVARTTVGGAAPYVLDQDDGILPRALRGEQKDRLRRPRLRPVQPTGQGLFQVVPVPGGTYSDDWGAPRVGHTHQGNDIMAPTGTPVYAVRAGRVTYQAGNGTCGGTVYLFTDQGYMLGCHLVRGGKTGRVKAGDIIGYVGGTGNASPDNPHLHFEWHPGGKTPGGASAVNPNTFLNEVYGDPRATPSDVAEARSTGGREAGPLTARQEREQEVRVEKVKPEQVAGRVASPWTWENYTPQTRDAIIPSVVAESLTPRVFRLPGQRKREMPTGLQGLSAQLYAGFMDAGRPDLARMVGTEPFETWTQAESGGDPRRVSGPINQGLRNGGLFQFWFGHDWAQSFYNGKVFTMTPYEQAQAVVRYFDLTPADIRRYAASIQAGTYRGWS